MEIGEIKKRILEKLKEGSSDAVLRKVSQDDVISTVLGMPPDKVRSESPKAKVTHSLKAVLDEYRQKIDELEIENKKLKSLLDEALAKNKALAEELDAKKKEKEVSKSDVELLRTEIYAMQKEYETKNLRFAELVETLKSKDKTLEAGRAEIAAMKELLDSRDEREMELKVTIGHLRSEVETRDAKIDADVKYYEKMADEIRGLRQKLDRSPRGQTGGI